MTRVAHITSAHPPGDVRILVRECAGLAAAGYDVELVARGEGEREERGVRILGVRVPAGRLGRMTVGAWRCFGRARAEHPDVYHIHDPELLLPALFARMGGAIVVYDIHENLPQQVLSKYWIPGFLRRPAAWLADRVERGLARAMSACVLAVPVQQERFSRVRRSALVQNFPETVEFASIPLREHDEETVELVYLGSLSAIRGAEEMVDALPLVAEHTPVRLTIAGRFWPEDLASRLAERPGWAHVRDLGWIDRTRTLELLGESFAGLVVFHPVPNHLQSSTTKLYEYVMAGLPVVASDFPQWRWVAEEAGCGVLVDPLSPADIARGVLELAADRHRAFEMATSGRRIAVERYSWESQLESLLGLYRDLAGAAKEGSA
jgi:glycosyltransferase involved in cell wall biosynthesis